MIEVLKQALDALETELFIDWTNNDEFNASAEKMHDAITSLQQAITEMESQEPVALPCCGYTDANAVKWNPLNGVVQCHNCGQNYTTSQRTWVGLTNNELQPIADEYRILFGSWVEDFARAIEAKLKEKNCAG
jgi:hypothetical protein